MWPTLYVNDYIVANKSVYRYSDPTFGDIVVFRPPPEAADPEQLDEQGNVKVDFIKRCVGVPGDLIEIREGQMFRNGQPVEEWYKHLSNEPSMNRYQEMSDAEKEALTKNQLQVRPLPG